MSTGDQLLAEELKKRQQTSFIMTQVFQPDFQKPFLEVRPQPRAGVSVEALQYQERNRGSCTHLLTECPPHQAPVVSTKHRLVGPEAQTIQEKNKQTKIDKLLTTSSGDINSSTPRPRPRVTGCEAELNLNRNHGSMKELLSGKELAQAFPQKVFHLSREAEENSRRNKETSMSKVFDVASNMTYRDPLPESRVKYEAVEIAQKNRGTLDLLTTGHVGY